MQRIPHGVTDQYIYFFAVDATDLKTPETGLSSFTVRRSRNGNASAAFTTPTINETDVTNMPGWYELLMDEDTSIDSGDVSQVMALHITHAGMDPAKVLVEIYRSPVTAGETLSVSSGALNAISDGLLTAAKFGSDFLTAAKVASDVGTEIAAAVWDRLTSALTTVGSAGKLLVDNLNATVSSRASQTSVDDVPTNAELATALGTADDAVLAQVALVKAKTDLIPTDPAETSDVTAAQAAILAAVAGVQTTVDDVPTNAEFAAAMTVIDLDFDAIAGLISGISIPSAGSIATAVMDFVVEGSYTFKQVTRLSAAALLGEISGAATATPILFKGLDGTSTRITMIGDQYGNRSSPTLNAEDA